MKDFRAYRGIVVVDDAGDRMFASLPAVFRRRDDSGDLQGLLGVLETFFLTGTTTDGHGLPGLEQHLEEIPALFSPIGTIQDRSPVSRTPEPFLHWLSTWLSFTPHALFAPAPLRRIVAGIVPMYGLRGTRDYLAHLLELCFEEEVAGIQIDDRPHVGFTVGESTLGIDTRLAVSRPFCFKVVIGIHASVAAHDVGALQHRVRAVIDFAKPAHTIYDMEWLTQPPDTHPKGHSSE